MAKSAAASPTSVFEPNAISLFDPENLQELDLLRRRSAPSLRPAEASSARDDGDRSSVSDVDRLFDELKVDEFGKDWNLGTIDINIIHRGPIRIVTSEWPALIMYCKSDVTENGIVKQFRLHVLSNARDVRLVYGAYRFRQQISKAWIKDYRCGKLIEATKNVRETMVNLAYWLTAKEHAEKNYATWDALIDEAATKLSAVN